MRKQRQKMKITFDCYVFSRVFLVLDTIFLRNIQQFVSIVTIKMNERENNRKWLFLIVSDKKIVQSDA